MLNSPFSTFQQWFDEAVQAKLPQVESMTLVTSTPQGKPSARLVLLKGVVDGVGFRFFTNYESRKAVELSQNPQAQLLFYWPQFGHQIRIEGTVQKVSEADSDAYFATRARGSQIGACASIQSRPMESMEELRARVLAVEASYEGMPIPRPANWGGFELRADRFEFWKDKKDRLHERVVYERSGGENEWQISRLYP